MSIGRLEQITNYKATDWMHIIVDPLGGALSWKASPISNFFGNIPTPIVLAGSGKIEKCEWIPASAARAPGVKPATYSDHGISGAWSFADGAEEYIHANIKIPTDMDLSVDSKICLGWSSAATSLNCDWEIAYLITAPDEDTAAAAEATEQSYEESSAVSNGMIITEFCVIPGGTIGDTDICLHIQVMRDGNDGSDTLNAAAEVHGLSLCYTSDKLGK